MTAPYPHPPSISAHSPSAASTSPSHSHLLTSRPRRLFPHDSSNIDRHPHSSQVTVSTANKKKHVCHICSKAFTTSGHLSRHTRIHTGERNHKCPFPGCDTRCSRQDNLQQHYRIHLTPGSRRNSASTRSQMLSGNKKHVKALPPTPEASLDSPPSTPPALELAVVPHVYSEPSPPWSALSYPSVREYVKQDYQDAVPVSHYFDPRGSPRRAFDAGRPPAPEELLSPTCPSEVIRGVRRDPGDNASGSEHGPPQDHIYVPSSGALLMTGSHAINGLSNTAPYAMYGTYARSTQPPLNHTPPTQSSDASMRIDVSFLQPRARAGPSNTRGQPLYTGIPSNQSHISPVTSSDSPSPVSSLSLSPHSPEHSPSLYQKPQFTMAVANDMTYPSRGPSQPAQLQASAPTHYHPPELIPVEEMYPHGRTTTPWQNSLSHVRGVSATHGGVGFVL
ncbi:hypothetical protein BC827DRAFT_1181288 [Russula dissimulans]|nr:hypothetical protein BC827DRAFT_1181288 [Russula dissimulans]